MNTSSQEVTKMKIDITQKELSTLWASIRHMQDHFREWKWDGEMQNAKSILKKLEVKK